MVSLLLDCDPGIDDALAIAYLARTEAADLRAVVCTAGNVALEPTIANARAWLDLAGAGDDVILAAGADGAVAYPHPFTPETHGPTGAGYAELPASERAVDERSGARVWAETARAHPGEVVGLVTGPMSTLAGALLIEPRLPRLLGRLVVMGGAFDGYPGNTTATAEWNSHVDPEAADLVYRAWADAREADPTIPPILACGLDVTERCLWTPEHSASLLAASGAPLTRALSDALRFYFEFHDSVGEGYRAQVHDPFVAWVALHQERVLSSAAHVRVETQGELTRGMTVADRRRQPEGTVNAEIVSGITGGPAAVDEVLAAVTAAISRDIRTAD